ncbi:hypothetical protein K461DRAFT_295039 [Myriangium duriaei CBS 260.36]|uniref:Peptidase S8/S53 domain-containing protein n=1 Tax=Myriangium duriaei CBS 260.36 TaxID=1168546 RepID=A0A9P4IYR0_9PEZI|nr:hypothetical protein K461DRAFT_295039 [Myriangium duriaei CBS 260.36]
MKVLQGQRDIVAIERDQIVEIDDVHQRGQTNDESSLDLRQIAEQGEASYSLHLINTMFDYGITVVAAAGNRNSDSRGFSPGSARGAITLVQQTRGESEARIRTEAHLWICSHLERTFSQLQSEAEGHPNSDLELRRPRLVQPVLYFT